jgi:chromosome partitioning protein
LCEPNPDSDAAELTPPPGSSSAALTPDAAKKPGPPTPATPASAATVEKLGNLYSTLQDLDKRYDVVIVDVAGNDSKEMRTAMTAAHQMIVTVRPSQLDLDTLPHMSELIEQAQDLNPALVVRGLISQAPTNPNGSERTDAGEYLADYPLITPMETVVYERKAYRDVIGEGLGVVEWTNPKARAEIQELAGEVTA